MAKQDELLAMLESGEARPGRSGFFAGWIETDHIFVQLLCVGQVHLALFELSGLEQLLGLVAGTTQQQNAAEGTEHESYGHHRCPFNQYHTVAQRRIRFDIVGSGLDSSDDGGREKQNRNLDSVPGPG